MADWGNNERETMLRRLNVPEAPPTYEYLCRLIRAWLFTLPFHNLDLLIGESPLGRTDAENMCIQGRGGGCHVHAAGFCALLQSLGFSAELASATIGAPGDHLLVTVLLDDEMYWIDVGNGQPYLYPFPSSKNLAFSHLGWSVRTTPTETGILLERSSCDQPKWRKVYKTTGTDKTWQDFSSAIERHHTEFGFGPFLTGLRAVDIGAKRMRTLRDDILTEYDGHRFHTTRLEDKESIIDIAAEIVPGRKIARRAVHEWSQRTMSATV